MAKSDGKAWVWYALDFSEDGDDGKMEQLALRYLKLIFSLFVQIVS